MNKPFYESKTLIFNALAIVAALLPLLEASLPQLQGLLPDNYYAGLSGVVTVGNIILRAITTSGLYLTPPEQR